MVWSERVAGSSGFAQTFPGVGAILAFTGWVGEGRPQAASKLRDSKSDPRHSCPGTKEGSSQQAPAGEAALLGLYNLLWLPLPSGTDPTPSPAAQDALRDLAPPLLSHPRSPSLLRLPDLRIQFSQNSFLGSPGALPLRARWPPSIDKHLFEFLLSVIWGYTASPFFKHTALPQGLGTGHGRQPPAPRLPHGLQGTCLRANPHLGGYKGWVGTSHRPPPHCSESVTLTSLGRLTSCVLF